MFYLIETYWIFFVLAVTAGAAVGYWTDRRSSHGEVVELFGVDGGTSTGSPLLGEVVDGLCGGVAGVIPPFEGDQKQRPPKVRTIHPVDEFH